MKYLLLIILMCLSCGQNDKYNEECALNGCPKEDKETQKQTTVVQGPKGNTGSKGDGGVNCYDDLDDVNGDGEINVKDCRGQNGINGVSCEVEQLVDGALITCANSQAVILNGKDGISPVLEKIEPCKKKIVPFPEIFLRLSDRSLIAYFEDNNNNRHLSALTPNTYVTTDGKKCYFRVNEDLTITEL